MMKINIKKLREEAIIPTRGSNSAAGYDLYADIVDKNVKGKIMEVTIKSHYTSKVGTGISIEIPEGYFGAVFARSGLATNQGLRPANCVGIIDSDYTEQLYISVANNSGTAQYIQKGERIAQAKLVKLVETVLEETLERPGLKTDRVSGFGSTGKN